MAALLFEGVADLTCRRWMEARLQTTVDSLFMLLGSIRRSYRVDMSAVVKGAPPKNRGRRLDILQRELENAERVTNIQERTFYKIVRERREEVRKTNREPSKRRKTKAELNIVR